MSYKSCLTKLALAEKLPVHEIETTAAEYEAQGLDPAAAMIRSVEDALELAKMEERQIISTVRAAYEVKGGKKRPAPAAPAKGKAAAAARAIELADYFTPGNVVKGYIGHDRVLEYTPAADGGFSVKVQHVVKTDAGWEVAPGAEGRERSHSTMPDAAALKAGPVERAPAPTSPQSNRVEYPPSMGNKTTHDGQIAVVDFMNGDIAKPELIDKLGALDLYEGVIRSITNRTEDFTNGDVQKVVAIQQKRGFNLDDEAPPAKPKQQAAAAERPAPAPKNTPEQEASKPAAPIADFGEKLEGAKKDLWKDYKKSIADALPEDRNEITMAKHFPEPNYEALLAAGVEESTLAAVKALRDEVPPKPRMPHKLRIWVGTLDAVRGFANDLLNGKLTGRELYQNMEKSSLVKYADRMRMYEQLGYPAFTRAKDYTLEEANFSMFEGKSPPGGVNKAVLQERGVSTKYFDNWWTGLDALKAKLATDPGSLNTSSTRTVKLDLYRTTGSRDIIIGKKVGAGKFIDLKGGFQDVRSARTYLAEHQAELEALLEQKKDVRPERRSVNDPRVGEDRRKGADISPEQFGSTFGFRGVQFGNYVEQKRRGVDLNNAYDALLDLADLIDVPPAALSLNGTLGLAFGARGSGGKNAFSAHFESDSIVINLTKNAGPGSLAHEWFHAFDNYFSRLRGKDHDFVTNDPNARKIAGGDDQLIRPEVLAAVKGVVAAINASGLPKRSQELDARRSKDYWGTTIELAARAFESYIIDKAAEKGLANDYLANILPENAHSAMNDLTGQSEPFPYPTRAEAPAINAAFDKLFETIESKKVDGREMLYSMDSTASPSDAAIASMIKEGTTVDKVLDQIEANSATPDNRVLAAALSKQNLKTLIQFEQAKAGQQFTVGTTSADNARGGYRPGDNTAILYREDGAEQTMLHELVHAATLRALQAGGLAATQIRHLWNYTKAQPAFAGQYGISNEEEFIAEAYANPAFRQLMRDTPAPGGKLSLWQRLLGIVHMILGRPVIVSQLLDRVMDAGADLMAENRGELANDTERANPGTDRRTRTIEVDGVRRPITNSKGQLVGQDFASQIAFWKWFDGSKATDAGGHPLVLYHGGSKSIARFRAKPGRGFFFTSDPAVASGYATDKAERFTGNANVTPAYLSMKKPFVIDAAGAPWNKLPFEGKAHSLDHIEAHVRDRGYDGVIVQNVQDLNDMRDAGAESVADNYVVFAPEQIKSATGNIGTFDPNNSDIRASIASAAGDAAALRLPAGYLVGDLFNHSGKLSWWHKTIGTMDNLARRKPAFAKVYESVQSFLGDVSRYAVVAADLAPTLLPKLENIRDVIGANRKHAVTAEDTKAIGAPIFEGTLTWARDPNGKPVKIGELETQADAMTTKQKASVLLQQGIIDNEQNKAWLGNPLDFYDSIINKKYTESQLKAGVVWTDAELASMFDLNPDQIALYHEFRASIDKSLTNLTISEMIKLGGKDAKGMIEQAINAPDLQAAAELLRDHFVALARLHPEQTDMHLDTAQQIMNSADRGQDLMDRGYAPLSRFGKYSVYVEDGGEQVYFGMFETQHEASKMARQMRRDHPNAQVLHGTVSEEAYKLFAGVSPETIELFGSMVGLDAQDTDAKSTEVYQTYLKLAKNNRSAMKRMIQRKGIAGFNEDAGRVLAGFVYSNARLTAGNAHLGEVDEAITAIPKQQGELIDSAMQLREQIRNPQNGTKLGGLMFAQFLGGSVASAMVNLTQPFTMTLPYLSQWGGIGKAGARLLEAIKLTGKESTGDAALDAALKWATDEGIVAPQEVHYLQAQAAGKGALQAGDGTKAGDARATLNNTMAKVQLGWGKLFAMAELTNRRLTFIAAYRTAVEEGKPNPAKFAQDAVTQTQGVYNCVDADTEILTKSGWKKHGELLIGEPLYALDESGKLVESSLVDVHRYNDQRGIKATHFTNENGFSMVLTGEHTCLVQNYNSRDKKYQRVMRVKASEVKIGHHFLRVPLGDATSGAAIYTDDEVRLFAWVSAEGCLFAQRGCTEKRAVMLSQSNTANPHYVAEIDALFARLGGHSARCHVRNGEMTQWKLRKHLWQKIHEALPGKMLTGAFLAKLTPHQMAIFLDVFTSADGHRPEEGGNVVTQKDIGNLNILQAMAVLSGKTSFVTERVPGYDWGRIYIAKNSVRSYRKEMVLKPVTVDMVWCPQTEHGTWIARRNGKTFVTGNSGNKPKWARGNIGGLLMTFKQYSIAYLELLSRMAFAGEPGSPERANGQRAALYMIAVLLLMSGADGIPFEQDLEDALDGIMQRLGYNFSTKRSKQAFLVNVLGEGGADFALKGLSATPGMPIDVAGRFGMGNLIPGTGLLTKKESYTRDLGELAGPAGDVALRSFTAAGKALGGDLAGAALDLSPAAVRNVAKGADMAATGSYNDARGYKVNDTSMTEAAMKVIGFQPSSTAAVQDAKGQALNMITQTRMESQAIAEHWAQGMAARDPAMIQEARDRLHDWNAKNPEAPVKVSMPGILKRVKAMKEDAIARTQKTAPKAIKAAVRAELAETR